MLLLDASVQKTNKGRVFEASCLAYVLCGKLYPGTDKNVDRPIWSVYLGSEAQLRPFLANLKLGKKIVLKPPTGTTKVSHEFLRSAKCQISTQRMPEGNAVTVFLPEYFRLDPGMVDNERIEFVLMPPREWLDQVSSEVDVEGIAAYAKTLDFPEVTEDQLALLIPTAYMFGVFLDRRTRCPLVADGRFYLQLLLSCLDHGLASFARDSEGYSYRSDGWGYHPRGFSAINTKQVGIPLSILISTTHESFEKLLAEQVRDFFRRTA